MDERNHFFWKFHVKNKGNLHLVSLVLPVDKMKSTPEVREWIHGCPYFPADPFSCCSKRVMVALMSLISSSFMPEATRNAACLLLYRLA